MPLQSVDFSIFPLNLVIPNIHLCLHAIVMYNIWIPYYLLDNMGIKQLKHCLGTIATITCTGVLSTHAWGYPCTYSQCLQLSLQTADFSSPVLKITLLSLELDGFSSHFCLQPSLVLLTMPRSNMHVSSHLETTPSIGSLPSVFASLSTACWSQHLSPELLLFAVESVLFAVESVLFAVESEHPFAGVGYSSAGVGHFSAPAFPCSPICYRRWESHSACSPVNI